MAFAGFTYGIIAPSSYSRAQNRVMEAGYANDTNTRVMISGINIERLYHQDHKYNKYLYMKIIYSIFFDLMHSTLS